MPNVYEPLTLEIEPPYIGSAVSPTVDITETTTDVTVTITDFRGEHSYTVEKTDQAIADAEQAATNANTAAGGANQAAQAATQAAGTANTAASNADTKAALADSKAALANTAAGQATTAASNANTAAGTANTAASNADAKAALADTAATNADTATQAANTATTAANNAAQAANNAADVAIEAAETITDGYFPKMLTGAAESLMGETDTATFAERVSSHDGVARIESILGNTVVSDGELLSVNIEGVNDREIPVSTYFSDGMKSAGSVHDELTMGKAVKRIGTVDLGTLEWYTGSTSVSGVYRLRSLSAYSSAKTVSVNTQRANVLCAAYPTTNASGMWSNPQSGVAIDTNGYIWVYDPNYNTLGSEVTFKSAMSGVMLYYELATPTETAIEPPLNMTYPVEQGGTESIIIPTGEQSAAPTMVIVYAYDADGVRDLSQAIIANIEGATASTNYAIGGYFVHGGKLYRATSAIATGETINPGTNCIQTTVMAELVALTA